jgi:adenine specific DNA methylase Mod
MLKHVSSIVFQKTYRNRHPQVRAKFEYNDHFYDLVVTDDKWEKLFRGPNALYSDFADYEFDSEFYLTIGLGAEYNGYHFKLVVGVMPLEDVEEKQEEWD